MSRKSLSSHPSRWVYGMVLVVIGSGVGHLWRIRTPAPAQKPGNTKTCPTSIPCRCREYPGPSFSYSTLQETGQALPKTSPWIEGVKQGDTAVLAEACMLSGPELAQYPSAASMKSACGLPVYQRVETIGVNTLTQSCQEHDGDSCALLAYYFHRKDTQKSRTFAGQACSLGKALGCVVLSQIDLTPALAEKACDAGRDEAGSSSWGCYTTARAYESSSNPKRDPEKALLYKAKACYRGVRSPMAANRHQVEVACADLIETITKGEVQLNPYGELR